MEYFRFPRTPHLAWLGPGPPRGDKVLSPDDARTLLAHVVIVEEKVDGANLGISLGENQEVRIQNRGAFVAWDSAHAQFKPLRQWLEVHRQALLAALRPELILFGEWCYATHSIYYTRLADWFLGFDVYDRSVERFWSADRRDSLMQGAGLETVPRLASGTFGLGELERLSGRSRLADGPAEGVYVRWDRGDYLDQRAKLVRAEFTQAIGKHWSRGPLRRNQTMTEALGG